MGTHARFVAASLLLAFVAVPIAIATTVDFDFYISYSGQSISGRLVGLNVDANGNATEVDPTSVLLFHVPAIVGLPASPANPYVFVPATFERSTYFSGTLISTTPGVYGYQVSNFSISPPQQNLLMIEASGDVTLVFNFGASLGGEGGVATYGIQANEDALWPAVNTFVSYTLVPPCVGDLNGDRAVDLSDLAVLLSDYGCTTSPCVDLNDDGRTDLADLAILLSHFGDSCP